MNISTISNASTTVTFNYLGSEHVWGILVSATYTFFIKDVSGLDGDLLQDPMKQLENAYARPNIAAKIGVDEFRNGNVTSFSFDESLGVNKITSTITIEESIRVQDDAVLYEITSGIPSPQDVESFSQTFNFSRGENSYSYDRTVDLKYKQDAGGDFLNKAYVFLKNIYKNNRPSFGYQVDGISENGRFNANLKPLISEDYDILNKQISLTENLSTSRIETIIGLPFSKAETFSLNLDENGYLNKNYSIDIQALSEPLEININSGLIITLEGIINQNQSQFGKPIGIEKGLNEQGGKATMSINFSNNPALNETTNVLYKASRASNQGEYNTYSFQMNISSKAKNKPSSFLLNKNFWQANINYPYAKIPSLFSEITSGQLNEISRNVSFDPFNNSVSDSSSFSTDPKYKNNNDGILKNSVSVNNTLPVDRNIVIPIFGDEEIVIIREGKTLGDQSITVDLVMEDVDLLEQKSFQVASGYLLVGYSNYLTNQSSTVSLLDHSVNSSLNFSYF